MNTRNPYILNGAFGSIDTPFEYCHGVYKIVGSVYNRAILIGKNKKEKERQKRLVCGVDFRWLLAVGQ